MSMTVDISILVGHGQGLAKEFNVRDREKKRKRGIEGRKSGGRTVDFIFLISYINFTLKMKILNRFGKAVVCCVTIIEMFIELENIHFLQFPLYLSLCLGVGQEG